VNVIGHRYDLPASAVVGKPSRTEGIRLMMLMKMSSGIQYSRRHRNLVAWGLFWSGDPRNASNPYRPGL
jgi:hypothetical protein